MGPPAITNTSSWVKIGKENDTVNVSSNTSVRYGDPASNRWVEKVMSGSFQASNNIFGDPAPGIPKEIQSYVLADESALLQNKLILKSVDGKKFWTFSIDNNGNFILTPSYSSGIPLNGNKTFIYTQDGQFKTNALCRTKDSQCLNSSNTWGSANYFN